MTGHRARLVAGVIVLGVSCLCRTVLAEPGDTRIQVRGPSGQPLTVTGPDWFVGDTAFVNAVVAFVHQDGVRLGADDEPVSLARRQVATYVQERGLGYYQAHDLSPVVQSITLRSTDLVAGVGLNALTVGITLGLWDARQQRYQGTHASPATAARRFTQLVLGPESLGLLNRRLLETGGVPAPQPGMRYLGPVSAAALSRIARRPGSHPKGLFITEAQWESFQASLQNLKRVLRR